MFLIPCNVLVPVFHSIPVSNYIFYFSHLGRSNSTKEKIQIEKGFKAAVAVKIVLNLQ